MTEKSLTEFIKRETKEKCDYCNKTVLMKAEIKTLLMERDISKVQQNDLAEINKRFYGWLCHGQYFSRIWAIQR